MFIPCVSKLVEKRPLLILLLFAAFEASYAVRLHDGQVKQVGLPRRGEARQTLPDLPRLTPREPWRFGGLQKVRLTTSGCGA